MTTSPPPFRWRCERPHGGVYEVRCTVSLAPVSAPTVASTRFDARNAVPLLVATNIVGGFGTDVQPLRQGMMLA